MYIQQLYTGCLSEAAYYVESNGQAAIIDPLRDIETYIELAAERGATIKYIFEKNGFEIIHQDKTGNNVETIFQLWITYVHQHITPFFRKIPVIRSAFRFITYTSLNISAIIFSKLLPNKKDLYLNNVLLAKKIKSVQ